jgi:AcrR family transcriptional regulator
MAARTLMTAHGFDGTTIEAIAQEAGVAPQTVYAVFGSKKGIVADLMDRARFGPAYREAVRRVKATGDPVEALRGVGRIAVGIYRSEQAELDLLRGAGTVSPELAVMAREKEHERYEAQAPLGAILARSKRLRPGITAAVARDVIWTLSGRENYRMLVAERGWSPAQYEKWLGDLLVRSLLTDEPSPVRRR